MTVLVFLIPISLGLGLLGLLAFVWTLRAGQYDDTEGARYRVLDGSADDRPLAARRRHGAGSEER